MEIIINLNSSKDAKDFSTIKNALIHKKEFDKVKQWISDKIQSLKISNTNGSHREHEAISILGSTLYS